MSSEGSIPPDQGIRTAIDPFGPIVFREDPLYRSKIDAVRPFDQRLSDCGGHPIRIVQQHQWMYIMQGNHRLYGAREDGLRLVEVLLYDPDTWFVSFGVRFRPWGSRNPTLKP
jgi:hypothetical protein